MKVLKITFHLGYISHNSTIIHLYFKSYYFQRCSFCSEESELTEDIPNSIKE